MALAWSGLCAWTFGAAGCSRVQQAAAQWGCGMGVWAECILKHVPELVREQLGLQRGF